METRKQQLNNCPRPFFCVSTKIWFDKIVVLWDENKSIKQIARELNITRNTIRRWVRIVIFTDEKYFMSDKDGRKILWGRSGERFDPKNMLDLRTSGRISLGRTIIVSEYICYEENVLVLRKSPKDWFSFKRWVKKCGHSVQDFEKDCQYFKDVVEVLRENCPNLKALSLTRLKKRLSPTSTLHFQKLTRLELRYCDELTDDCVNQFLNNDMEELTIEYNKRVTGRFLNNFKFNKMKQLIIKHCRAFKFPYLLSAEYLTNLKMLWFWKQNRSKIEIRDKLHLLLDKYPNLQNINFEVHEFYDVLGLGSAYSRDRLAESNIFFESVCRLSKLEVVKANFHAWDHHFEALGSSCKELSIVDLICKHVTGRGLDALCYAARWLCKLDLSESEITDDDVVACVYACPNLMIVNICDCPLLVSAVQRIAEARREMRDRSSSNFYKLGFKLHLTVNTWEFYGDEEDYKDVINIRFPGEEESTFDRQY